MAELSAELRPELTDTIRNASSRGPGYAGRDAQQPVIFKPDLTAPGTHIRAAWAGSGDRALTKTGTSMAAPHVTGSVALLLQAHPDWEPSVIKSVLLGTATPSITDGELLVPLVRQGAGRVDVEAATRVQASVSSSTGPVMDFGLLTLPAIGEIVRTAVVTNHSESDVTFIASSKWLKSPAAGKLVLDAETLTIPAGKSQTLRISVMTQSLEPWALFDPGVSVTTTDDPAKIRQNELEALVLLEPDDGGPTLSIPLYALLRPEVNVAFQGCLPEGLGTVTATSIQSASLMPFTLIGDDERGSQHPAADLIRVAARVRVGPEPAILEFALTFAGKSLSPGQVSAAIFFDTDGDSLADMALMPLDAGRVDGDDDLTGSNRSVLVVMDEDGVIRTPFGRATRVHDLGAGGGILDPTLLLPVPLAALELDPSAPWFLDFWIWVWDRQLDTGGAVDRFPDGGGGSLLVGNPSRRLQSCELMGFDTNTEVIAEAGFLQLKKQATCPEGPVTLVGITPGPDPVLAAEPSAPAICPTDPIGLVIAADGACEARFDPRDFIEVPTCGQDKPLFSQGVATLGPGRWELDVTATGSWGTTTDCVVVAEVAVPAPQLSCLTASDGLSAQLNLLAPCGADLSITDCGSETDCPVSVSGAQLVFNRTRFGFVNATVTATQEDGYSAICTVRLGQEEPPPETPAEPTSCQSGGRPSPAGPVALLLLLGAITLGRRKKLLHQAVGR